MRIKNMAELGVVPTLSKTRMGFLDTEVIEAELVSRCERAFEHVHGVPASHAMTGVSNGTDALILTLEALDVGAGDTFIAPGLTWQATAASGLDINAVPVLLDIDPNTLCLSPDAVVDYLEECNAKGVKLPKAMIVVHMFDHAADMDAFPEIARRYGIFLIEDCAHAHGGRWRDRALGTFGVAATFSTQRTKPLSGLKRPDDDRWQSPTGSEGGFVLTGVPIIDIRIRALASCGRKVERSQIDPMAECGELTAHWREQVGRLGLDAHPLQSGNNRLAASAAERLLDQLDRFPAEHRRRQNGLLELRNELGAVRGLGSLAPQPHLTTAVVHMATVRFDPSKLAGMDSELFRQIMSYLLDGYFLDIPYHPLGGGPAGYNSPVYNPQTKRRYRISADHWEAIDPRQWKLPNAHHAYHSVVTLEGTALAEPGIGDAFARAATWTSDHADWLVTTAS